jgi:hypothetical protein
MQKPVLRRTKSLLNRRRRHLYHKRTDSSYVYGGRPRLFGEREVSEVLASTLGREKIPTEAVFRESSQQSFSENGVHTPIHLIIDIYL